jgi:hypothetical protein
MVTDSLSVSQTPLNTKWLDGILKRQTEYVSLLMTFTKLLEKFLSKKKFQSCICRNVNSSKVSYAIKISYVASLMFCFLINVTQTLSIEFMLIWPFNS